MPSKKVLATALKARIRANNLEFFTPEDWDGDAWLEVPLGRFYDENEEMVDVVVFEVTRNVLKKEQRKMPASAEDQLAERVNVGTTPPDAVNEMFAAAQFAGAKKKRNQISRSIVHPASAYQRRSRYE
jgi:hypothetical protein